MPLVEAPAHLTPAQRRKWDILAAAERQRIAARGGLREFRCGGCRAVLFEYLPPIGLQIERCHHCGEWNKFSSALTD